MAKGVIKFATESSEFLTCSCGNDVMDSGFELIESNCEDIHYGCARCGAYACVDFGLRIVNNIDAAKVAAKVGR